MKVKRMHACSWCMVGIRCIREQLAYVRVTDPIILGHETVYFKRDT